MARLKARAERVIFHCAEGYTSVVPVEDAKIEDSIISVRINGQPLKHEQGYPARPIIPPLYGWKSTKWLARIGLVNSYRDGYWEAMGYHERGEVWDEERFKGHLGKHRRRRKLSTVPV